MNPLQSELHRLYLPLPQAPADRVRAIVMELARPPAWNELARVWHGVQDELALPAPAIAVSGTDGLQLWFSLAEPVPAAQGPAFLDGLRRRFLPEVAPGRVRLLQAPDASAPPSAPQALPVPACRDDEGRWSAFVAPDLAPVFDDTPWLDIPPNEEGQAALLRGLQPIKPAAFRAALDQLGPGAPPPRTGEAAAPAASAADAAATDDPRRFLLRVMNDESVAMALRIEAARALLQHPGAAPPGGG
ncbi:hypothetical protein V4F39_01305 [Aquincola sp. MAHUQ-54]|uniref:DUF721 domain-containing protein n=1 Tax=Aquincola agrisoli TaxID=3119538 RepID=A0AAW9QBD1_9BURK